MLCAFLPDLFGSKTEGGEPNVFMLALRLLFLFGVIGEIFFSSMSVILASYNWSNRLSYGLKWVGLS